MAKAKAKVRLLDAKNAVSGDVGRTFTTGVDLSPTTRNAMIELLNQQLANTADLQSQTKQAHWNVKGSDFYSLHLLFDALAAKRLDESDEIAERVTAVGGYATGTVRMAAANSEIPELPTNINSGTEYVQALVERYSIHANSVRTAIDRAVAGGDVDTSDLFTQISRELDKDLWFLQAHLQG